MLLLVSMQAVWLCNTLVTTYYSIGVKGMKEEKEGSCVCNAIFQLVCLWL